MGVDSLSIAFSSPADRDCFIFYLRSYEGRTAMTYLQAVLWEEKERIQKLVRCLSDVPEGSSGDFVYNPYTEQIHQAEYFIEGMVRYPEYAIQVKHKSGKAYGIVSRKGFIATYLPKMSQRVLRNLGENFECLFADRLSLEGIVTIKKVCSIMSQKFKVFDLEEEKLGKFICHDLYAMRARFDVISEELIDLYNARSEEEEGSEIDEVIRAKEAELDMVNREVGCNILVIRD